jgi:hypothetical protein
LPTPPLSSPDTITVFKVGFCGGFFFIFLVLVGN